MELISSAAVWDSWHDLSTRLLLDMGYAASRTSFKLRHTEDRIDAALETFDIM